MRVCVLGSGSAGNATYIATRKTAVLVDLGFGWRSLKRRFQQADLSGEKIEALLLSHGHADHVVGVSSFVSRHPVPVYMTEGTRAEVPELQSLACWCSFPAGSSFSIGDLEIETFSVPHDALQPVGFRFSAPGVRGALVTDLGELTAEIMEKLSGCDWLILESNHDEDLLKVGPYPWAVKQRVLSRLGHLSNQELSLFLSHHFDARTAHLFLAHLSRQNNDPKIALSSASSALSRHAGASGSPCRLHLTHQDKPSIVLDL